mgnify:CR=1 FL=1
MKKSDFYFDLPEELIAQTPLERRDASRLLTLDKTTGAVEHHHFYELPQFLRPNDCLILNDSRVLPARLLGHRSTGGAVEVLLLRDLGDGKWECLTRPGRKTQPGTALSFGDGELTATVVDAIADGNKIVQFHYEGIFLEVLERLGKMPLPPYIKAELQDQERYQTVYSKFEGSVAAPTAGLHFTPEVLNKLKEKNIPTLELTLHVGAGTFKPVKSETLEGHEMHTEYISVSRNLIDELSRTDRRVIAVGTTSVRTLESLYYIGKMLEYDPNILPESLTVGQWQPYDGSEEIDSRQSLRNIVEYLDRRNMDRLVTATQIIIAPGYRYHIVQGMITNFHQPQSTLLLLVSAFVNGRWREIYDYALSHDFRFLSYGDSSLLLP